MENPPTNEVGIDNQGSASADKEDGDKNQGSIPSVGQGSGVQENEAYVHRRNMLYSNFCCGTHSCNWTLLNAGIGMFLVGLFYVVSGVLIHPSVFKLVFKDQYIFEKGTQINFEDYDKAVFPNLTVPLGKFKKAEVNRKVFIFYEIGGLNQLTLSAPSDKRKHDLENFSK